MIIDNKVDIKISRRTISYYRNLGYKCNINDTISIDIEELPKGSSIRINVRCDICGYHKNIEYCDYNKNINNCKLYSCSSKCSNFKVKKTKKLLYGDENFNNMDKI